MTTDDIQRLVQRAQEQIARDQREAAMRQDSYQAKRERRIREIIEALVTKTYGEAVPEVIDQVKRCLPASWFRP